MFRFYITIHCLNVKKFLILKIKIEYIYTYIIVYIIMNISIRETPFYNINNGYKSIEVRLYRGIFK